MSKYQINYNRVVPDHRMPFDYKFIEKIRNPLDYAKAWISGFNSSWLRYYHIHLVGVHTLIFGGCIIYFMWDSKKEEIVRDRLSRMPSLHFVHQLEKGRTPRFDNVLQKFENDPLGGKDQAFEDL